MPKFHIAMFVFSFIKDIYLINCLFILWSDFFSDFLKWKVKD